MHGRLAHGERAGFVKGDHFQRRGALQMRAAFEEHALARAVGNCRKDGSGRGNHQSAGRSHHQPRHRTVKRCAKRLAPCQRRHRGKQHRPAEYELGILALKILQRALGFRLRLLRFFHHLHDLGKGAFLRKVGDAHFHRASGVDRRGEYLIAGLFEHGHRFAGDGRLVNLGYTCDHLAVNRKTLARAHEHNVAQPQFFHRHGFPFTIFGFAGGDRRAQIHQAFNGAAGAPQSIGLQGVGKRKEEKEHRTIGGLPHQSRAQRGKHH